MPTKESQMLRTMRSFAVLLAIILGSNSPIYLVYRRDIVDAYDVMQPRLETLVDQYPNEPIHAELLRWIQRRLHENCSEAKIVLGPSNSQTSSSFSRRSNINNGFAQRSLGLRPELEKVSHYGPGRHG
jgi:hypothetical protein